MNIHDEIRSRMLERKPDEVPAMIMKGHAAIVLPPLTAPSEDQIRFDVLSMAIEQCRLKLQRTVPWKTAPLIEAANRFIDERKKLLIKYRNTVVI